MQGIDPTVDYKKVLKAFKKEFCCNGTVVEDPEQARARRAPRATSLAPARCVAVQRLTMSARLRCRGM